MEKKKTRAGSVEYRAGLLGLLPAKKSRRLIPLSRRRETITHPLCRQENLFDTHLLVNGRDDGSCDVGKSGDA